VGRLFQSDDVPSGPIPSITLSDLGGGEDTIHGMDTVILLPSSDGADATKTSSPVKPAAVPPPIQLEPVVPESFYVESPSPGTPPSGSLDERSERMFREQFDKGMKAVSDQDWKQAVHYLSIAAAIHPSDDSVRAELRRARDQKAKSEKQG
jgi:hypothetical protein